MATQKLSGISSMATREVLAELAQAYERKTGYAAQFESVGGVDAAKRVRAGEVFAVVVLAADAMASLVAAGRILADSKKDLFRSPVAVAVRSTHADARQWDIRTEAALKQTILSARSVGYSTGPSGTELLRLLARWGIAQEMHDRMIQAPPGTPVGQMVAAGAVELGFQQLSEMQHVPGLAVLGLMPPACAIVSTFTAGICTAFHDPQLARDLIAFMHSPEADATKRRHGMEAA